MWRMRVCLAVVLLIGYGQFVTYQVNQAAEARKALTLKQFQNDDAVAKAVRESANFESDKWSIGWLVVVSISLVMLSGDFMRAMMYYSDPERRSRKGLVPLLLLCTTLTGCWKPFEPNQLEDIGTSEVGFLLPLTGDGKAQEDNNKEEFLSQNMVSVRQVRIPQQWIETSFSWGLWQNNGEWKPSARLVKVDTAPVTREWTADENSGTSNKKEAVWVMTSDQVEFSTGWVCTARIVDREAAVKFLHNYRSDSLQEVMDREVRAKLQTAFALEVTDLPMTKLRLEATPHITKVVKDVTDFFATRGVQITNLGISGGFVYKDPSIQATMVRVFNAEQEKAVATAEWAAQEERNKTVKFAAEGKAEAIKIEKTAEAEGIKSVADAKAYEIDKAEAKSEMYMALKQIEVELAKASKWDGRYPVYYMGMGTGGNSPSLMLNVPAPAAK